MFRLVCMLKIAICMLKIIYDYVVLIARIIHSTCVHIDRMLRHHLIEIGRYLEDLESENAETARRRGQRRKGTIPRFSTYLRSQRLQTYRTTRRQLKYNRPKHVMNDITEVESVERRRTVRIEQHACECSAMTTTDTNHDYHSQIADLKGTAAEMTVGDSESAHSERDREQIAGDQIQIIVDRNITDVSTSEIIKLDDGCCVSDSKATALDLTEGENYDPGQAFKECRKTEPAEQTHEPDVQHVVDDAARIGSENEQNEDCHHIADSKATATKPTKFEKNYDLRYDVKGVELRLVKKPKHSIADARKTMKNLNASLRADDMPLPNIGTCFDLEPTVKRKRVETNENDPTGRTEQSLVSKNVYVKNEQDILSELSSSPPGVVLPNSRREEPSEETKSLGSCIEIGKEEKKLESPIQHESTTPPAVSGLNWQLQVDPGKWDFTMDMSFTDSESATLQVGRSTAAKNCMDEFNKVSDLKENNYPNTSLIITKDTGEEQTNFSGEKNSSINEVPRIVNQYALRDQNFLIKDRDQESSEIIVSKSESEITGYRPNEIPTIIIEDTENVQDLNLTNSKSPQNLASEKSPKEIKNETDRNADDTPKKSKSKSRRKSKAKSKRKQQGGNQDSPTVEKSLFRSEENTQTDDSRSPSLLEKVHQERKHFLRGRDEVSGAVHSPQDSAFLSSSGTASLEHDSPKTKRNKSMRNRSVLSPQGSSPNSARDLQDKGISPEGNFRTSTPTQNLELENFSRMQDLVNRFEERLTIEDRILANWVVARKKELKRHKFDASCTSDHGESSPDDGTSAEEPSPAKSPREKSGRGEGSNTGTREESEGGRRENATWLPSEKVYSGKFNYETSCENISSFDFSKVPDFPPPGPSRSPRQAAQREFPPSVLDGRSFDVVQQPDGNYTVFELPAPGGNPANPAGTGVEDFAGFDLSVNDRYLMDEYRDVTKHTGRGFIDSKVDATKQDEGKIALRTLIQSLVSDLDASASNSRVDPKVGGVDSQPLGPQQTKLPFIKETSMLERSDIEITKSVHKQDQGSIQKQERQACDPHTEHFPRTTKNKQSQTSFTASVLAPEEAASTGAKSKTYLKTFPKPPRHPPPYEAIEGDSSNARTVLLNAPIGDSHSLVITLGEPISGATGGLFQAAEDSCGESAAGQSSRDISGGGGPPEGSPKKHPVQKGKKKKKKSNK